ncbi:heme exporter protein B1 [Salmonella enterica subsp. enterica]|uniref:Heme exporter protein B1 n=1 Tax=Salmonella enterica I TaxID=59201 RepID=A0A447TZK5_SALET|nr:heme exporter protein B1 [Salmonella enterica subsp. enterica]
MLIFAAAAMDAASMHLPADGYLAVLGGTAGGQRDVKPVRHRGGAAPQRAVAPRRDGHFTGFRRSGDDYVENPSSAGGAAPAVSDLRQARAVAGGGRHHRAGHRLGPGLWFRPRRTTSRGRATALCTCMSRRPSGQWVSMRRWRWRRLPGWSGR